MSGEDDGYVKCPDCPKSFKNLARHTPVCQRKIEESQRDEEFRRRQQAQQRSGGVHKSQGPDRPDGSSPDEQPVPEPRVPMADDIRTDYHPNSGKPRRHDAFEEYRRQHRSKPLTPEKKHDPWFPFESRADFEFSELALKCCLNQNQITAFLDIFQRCLDGEDTLHFKNYSDLSRTWNSASHLLTPMELHTVKTEFKGIEKDHQFYCRSLWDWAVDLVKDPTLAPYFEWDAQRLFKFDAEKEEWVRFVNEPWTADRFYDVQSTLPKTTLNDGKIADGKPLAFTLYADKTQLSTFGGQLAHPVYAAVANLPVFIRNGGETKLGGSRLVGWLPIVPDSEQSSNSWTDKDFADYKRVVWHGCLGKFLESIFHHGKEGCWVRCGDGIERWLFPLILILSADYEEQCTMVNTRGFRGLLPCPICIVPRDKLVDLTTTFSIRDITETENMNAFATIANSDPFEALSFDRLHSYHNGLGGKHLWGQVMSHIKAVYGEKSVQMRTIESRAREFPTKFQDGLKNQDLMKICLHLTFNLFTPNDKVGHQLLKVVRCFINLDTLAGFDNHTSSTIEMIRDELASFENELKAYMALDPEDSKNWNFPKVHMQVHLIRDIWSKGVTKNTNTKVFESMHRLLKEFYLYMTNFKNFDGRVLELEHWAYTAAYIRNRIEVFDGKGDLIEEDDVLLEVPIPAEDGEDPTTQTVDDTTAERLRKTKSKKPRIETPKAFDHVTLGASQKIVSFVDYCAARRNDTRFNTLADEMDSYLAKNAAQIQCGHPNTKIHEYYYLKVHFESRVSWETGIDRLRCNPSFMGSPRYDAVVVNNGEGMLPSFARLGALFTVEHPTLSEPIPFAFVEVYDRPISEAQRKKDGSLGLFRVRARPRSTYRLIHARAIIRGALLVPVFGDSDSGFFVFDVVDGDMFLRVREMWTFVEV
ncbi:hypothetical protein DFP72DRAFT_991199 [Ephemerocybe angulata]|uniref:Uncharacterized protein n=1 Tax=Ephemerocybe angulata TaxID=980116 RepID=A0A8H6M2C7_9AGAR|nr:hypothetical protein DFP72DRAFT_991199 [Tulosesus angulatus]